MGSGLYKFMTERYQAFPLMLMHERAVPGMLLECQWKQDFPIFGKWSPVFERTEAFAWDLLSLPAGKYKSIMVKANVIQESVTEKLLLGGGVNVPQFGLDVGASLSSSFSAVFRVTGIESRVFDNTRCPYTLMQALLKLKKEDPSLWDWVNDDFLIVESYYVTSFSAQFKNNKGLSAKGEFVKAGVDVKGKVELKWLSDSTLEMVGTPSVPLAVRGIKV
jgi:hypothetical protein